MTDKPGTPAVRTLRAQGLVNLVVRGLLRTPGLSRIIGSRLVTLYVAGRKSGRRYTVPVSYLAHGDDLLIGTSSGWARNLRTGEPLTFRFKGKTSLADVQTLTAEPNVVTAYAGRPGRETGAAPGQGLRDVVEAAVLRQPVSEEALSPVAARAERAQPGQASGRGVLDAAAGA